MATLAPQGYVYTFDPAAIFARRLGGNATLLNRVYIAALQRLAENNESIPNMKVFAFNDYIDKRAVGLVEKALSKHPNIRVVAKGALFNDGKSKTYRWDIRRSPARRVHYWFCIQ